MNFDKYQKINDQKVNFREMEDATVVSNYRNQGCGDGYRVFLRIDGRTIADASYTTTGCGFGLAALAIVTELARGKTLEEAEKITTADINAGLDGFPPRRQNYPASALEAFRQALEDYRSGRGIPEEVRREARAEALETLRNGGSWIGLNIGAVNLDGERLDGIVARGVNLARASLRGASLAGADLTDANFHGAFLNDANLTNARLIGADLRWCKLSGARLDGADLTGAVFDAGTRLDPDKVHLFELMRPSGKQLFVSGESHLADAGSN